MKEGRKETNHSRAQELCQERGGRLGLPVTIKSYGFCGRKAPRKKKRKKDNESLQKALTNLMAFVDVSSMKEGRKEDNESPQKSGAV